MLRTPCLLLLVLLTNSCGQLSTSGGPMSETPSVQRCDNSAVEYKHYFESIESLVAESDELLVGVVTGVTLRPPQGPDDARRQPRVLTVAVEETFKGRPPATVVLETFGWDINENGTTKLRGPDCPWFEQGDRAVMALTVQDDQRGASSSTSLYLLRDDQVGDTQRSGPVARTIEAMSEPELIAALRSASWQGSPQTAHSEDEGKDGWGPMSVMNVPDPQGANEAGAGTGRLVIDDACVFLRSNSSVVGKSEYRITLFWRSGQVRWVADKREIVFADQVHGELRLKDGDRITVGGSGHYKSLPNRDWLTKPGASCPTRGFTVHSIVPMES